MEMSENKFNSYLFGFQAYLFEKINTENLFSAMWNLLQKIKLRKIYYEDYTRLAACYHYAVLHTLENLFTLNILPKNQMTGISSLTVDSFLNNNLYFLNSKSELGGSNSVCVANSESKVALRKSDTTGNSNVRTNICYTAGTKNKMCSENDGSSNEIQVLTGLKTRINL